MNNPDRYSSNSYFNYYTPSRSTSNTAKGMNDLNQVPHPSDTKISQQTKHIFAVDSRQRDFSKFPDSNEYTIDIPEYYKNIKSLELKAAIVPKTEYNIHSCNKEIPFSIGDFISNVTIPNQKNYFSGTRPVDGLDVTLIITSEPPPINVARLTATTLNGGIGPITIEYGGSGYSPDSKIYIKAELDGYNDNFTFDVKVGIHYTAILREGHYSNTGNPKYFHIQSNGTRTPMYSYTPVPGLSREIECAFADAVYSRNQSHTSYAYGRIGWYELPFETDPTDYDVGASNQSLHDKPAPIAVRYNSQYPVLERLTTSTLTTEVPSSYYETNACDFNRIDFCNQLIIKLETTDDTPDNIGGFFEYDSKFYEVIDYYFIGETTDGGGEYEFLLVLYPRGTYAGAVRTEGMEIRDPALAWTGIKPSGTLGTAGSNYFLDPANITTNSITPSKWHILLQSPNADIASLLGFRRVNYINGVVTDNVEIDTPTGTDFPYLYGYGLTHRTTSDWTLYPGPEYIILSFRSSLTNTATTYNSEMNDRIDSDQDSNLGRTFAALVLDNNQPAVLQGLTYARGIDFDLAGRQSSSTNYSPILNLSNEYETDISTNVVRTHSRLLDGYVGNTDSGLYISPGITKALRGTDFDIKKIEFKTPVSRLSSLSIRFSKFNKLNTHTSKELYDFKSRDNLLLFEIITEENLNVF